MLVSQKYPSDPVPSWMRKKATQPMKAEYEAAMCRRLLDEGFNANAAAGVNWQPRELLPYLKQEHKRWKDVSVDMMVVTN